MFLFEEQWIGFREPDERVSPGTSICVSNMYNGCDVDLVVSNEKFAQICKIMSHEQ